jgi:hypothetical protein
VVNGVEKEKEKEEGKRPPRPSEQGWDQQGQQQGMTLLPLRVTPCLGLADSSKERRGRRVKEVKEVKRREKRDLVLLEIGHELLLSGLLSTHCPGCCWPIIPTHTYHHYYYHYYNHYWKEKKKKNHVL